MNLKNTTLAVMLVLVSVNAHALQECRTEIIATTPNADFTINNDGTVTHTKTKLMWKRCSEGQTFNSANNSCTGTSTIHTWGQALQIPQTLNSSGGFAGHSNWRLPNIKELSSIVELKCTRPALNKTLFPGVTSETPSSFNWTSSIYSGGSSQSKIVGFYSDSGFNEGGDANISRVVSFGVRLVRVAE